MKKGMIATIRISVLAAILLGLFIGMNYLFFNTSPVLAQAQNTSTNNMTLSLLGYGYNNSEFYTQYPINFSLAIKNISEPSSIQFATVYIINGSGGYSVFNLTNATAQSNTTHQVFYNSSLVAMGTFFSNKTGKGDNRNLTIKIYNKTGDAFEWLNDSATHLVFNFTVNELASQRTAITLSTSTFNASHFNNTELYTNITALNFTLNSTAATNCTSIFDDRTIRLTNSTPQRSAFHNASVFTFIAAREDSIRNNTAYCIDSFGNTTWANQTVGATYINFTVNERRVNSVTVSAATGGIVNSTVYKGYRAANVTLNRTMASVIAVFNKTTSVTLTNLTTRLYYGNTSTITFGNNTYTHPQDNVTWKMCDAFSNCTWYNVTHYMVYYTIDSWNPVILSEEYAIGNKSTGGNYLNVTFNVTDHFPNGCGARLELSNGTTYNISGESSINISAYSPWCYLNITPSNINFDGRAVVQPYGIDQSGRIGYASRNQTFSFVRMKTGWNLVASYENKTMADIAKETTGISYVSMFNNTAGAKTFMTFTTGGSSLATYTVGVSNATWLYVTSDAILMRNWTSDTIRWNTSLYTNTSTTSGWNVIGMLEKNVTLNQSMWGNYTFMNATNEQWSPNGNNITWGGFYDSTLGQFCMAYRTRLAVSCGSGRFISTNMTIPEGLGLYLWLNDNVTVNATNITGRGPS